jgi:hypothetical protein
MAVLRAYTAFLDGVYSPDRDGKGQMFHPGFVIDVTGEVPRYGGQATLWGNYAHAGARPWAFPLFPFLRAQAVVGMGFVFTGGLMLKLPLPVS